MSLINQMLHDLDSRRLRVEPQSAGYVVAGLHSPRAAFSSAASLTAKENRISAGANVLLLSLGILLAAVVWRYMSLVADEKNIVSSGAKTEIAIIEHRPVDVAPLQTIQMASLPATLNDRQDGFIPLSENTSPLTQHTEISDSIKKSDPIMSEIPSVSISISQPSHQTPRKESTAPKINATEMTKKLRPLSPEQIAETAYRAGLENIQKGNMGDGIQKLYDALTAYQGHIKAREILAGLLIKSGQSVEAGDLLSKGIEIHPGNSQFVKLYSRILLERGNRETALQVLEANKPALIDDVEYYAILAAVHQQLNQPHEAARIYNQLVSIQPRSGVFWMGLGISLEADGKPDKAIDAYQRAKGSGTLDSNLMRFINGKITSLKNVPIKSIG